LCREESEEERRGWNLPCARAGGGAEMRGYRTKRARAVGCRSHRQEPPLASHASRPAMLLHYELGGAVEIFGKDEAVQLADAWMITCGGLYPSSFPF